MVLKLSVCEVSSEVLIHHVLFVEMGEFANQQSSFEEAGVLTLLDGFMQGRPRGQHKHRLIDFFEGLLIETSQVSLTMYTGINDIPEQHQLLLYLSQLKVNASISSMNGRSQEENTAELIQKLNNELSLLKAKTEAETKNFRQRIRLVEDMLHTPIDVDSIGMKGFLSELSGEFVRQKATLQATEALKRSNLEQQRRLVEAEQ